MLEINTLIKDRYLIRGYIHKGGMGAVYKAHDQFGTAAALVIVVLLRIWLWPRNDTDEARSRRPRHGARARSQPGEEPDRVDHEE